MAFQEVGVRAVVKGFSQYMAQTGRLNATTKKLGNALKVGLTVGAVAAGAAVLKSVTSFASFDAAMTKSIAIMGDVSDAMRKKMAEAARQMAKETTFSAKDAAESYFFLASAGLDAEASILALPKVAKFAQAGMFDMALATDLLTDAQSALGLTIRDDAVKNMENMVKVSDVLVKANTLANATVQQFSESLTSEAGAALKTFNIDIEEGVAVLAAFADQGVKGQVAGTGLSRILRLMTSAAVKNADAYDELGVSVFDSSGNINNMADIVGDLEKALGNMSDEQRVAALETLGFQARVQGVILPLLGSSEAIRQYESDLRDAGDTTEEVAEKQLQTFSAQVNLLMSHVEDAFIVIGSKFVPALTKLSAWFRLKGIPRIAEFVKLVKNNLNVAIAALIPVVALLTAGLWAMVAPLIAAAAPVVAAVAALAALSAVFALIEAKTGFFSQSLFPVLRDDVLPILMDLGTVVLGLLKEAFETLRNLWENLEPPIVDFIEALRRHVLPLMEKLGGFLKDHKPLMLGLALAITALVAPWVAVIAIIVLVLAKWDEISQLFTRTIPDAIDKLIRKVEEIPIIGQIFKAAVTAVKLQLVALKTQFTVVFNSLKVIVETAFKLIRNRIEFYINTVRNTIKIVTSLIKGDWEGAWDALKQIFVDAWNTLQAEAKTVLTGFLGVFDAFWDGIKSGVISMVRTVAEQMSGVLMVVQNVLNGMVKAYNSTIGKIAGSIDEVTFATDLMAELAAESFGDFSASAIGASASMQEFGRSAVEFGHVGAASAELDREIARLEGTMSMLRTTGSEVPPILEENAGGIGDVGDAAGDAAEDVEELEEEFVGLAGALDFLGSDLAVLRENARSLGEQGLRVLNEQIAIEESRLRALDIAMAQAVKAHEGIEAAMAAVDEEIRATTADLDRWKNVALEGSQAFSDAMFGLSQETDKLQRSINEVKLGVLTEDLEEGGFASAKLEAKIRTLARTLDIDLRKGKLGIEEIDKVLAAAGDQMDIFGLKSSNLRLDENLELGKQRRDLEALINPIEEASFEAIIAGITNTDAALADLNVQQVFWNDQLAASAARQAALTELQENQQQILADAKTAYDNLDEAVGGIDEKIKAIWELRGDEFITSIEEAFAAIDRGQVDSATRAIADAQAIMDNIRALVPGAETGVFAPIEKVLRDAETSINVDITAMADRLETPLLATASGVAALHPTVDAVPALRDVVKIAKRIGAAVPKAQKKTSADLGVLGSGIGADLAVVGGTVDASGRFVSTQVGMGLTALDTTMAGSLADLDATQTYLLGLIRNRMELLTNAGGSQDRIRQAIEGIDTQGIIDALGGIDTDVTVDIGDIVDAVETNTMDIVDELDSIHDTLYDGVDAIVDAIYDVVSAIGSISSGQHGGILQRSGLLFAHAGEAIMPRSLVTESVRDMVLNPRVQMPALPAAPAGGDFNANISVTSQDEVAEEVGREMRSLAFSLKKS